MDNNKKNIKINLGGTCGNSKWRNILIPMLSDNIIYRNSVVDNWKYTEEEKNNKKLQMKECDYLVYVITPKQTGFSAIASAVDYSNKVPEKLLFCVLFDFENQKFEGHKYESIKSVIDIIKDNNCKVFDSLNSIANYLNNLV